MRNVYIYGDSLLKATVPDEELKYHFHLPEIMARYPSDRVQVTNRAKMGATVSKGLSLVEHDAQRGLDADYALICYGGNDSDYDWAAIAAVADQGVIRIQSPRRVVLHQRQALGHGGAHLGPVRHLHPVRGIAGHDLRQVKMIFQLLVRHSGLQQRISVNIHIAHHTAPPKALYLI